MRLAILVLSLVALLGTVSTAPAQNPRQDFEKLKKAILKDFDQRIDREIKRMRKSMRRDLERSIDAQFAKIMREHMRGSVAAQPAKPARPAHPIRPARPKLAPKTPGWLGVYLGGAGAEHGVRVQGTIPGGPAAAAGLKAGDVILKVGGKSIQGPESLVRALAAVGAGKKVTMLVGHGDAERFVQVRLGVRPKDGVIAAPVRPARKPAPKRVPKPAPKPAVKQAGWLGVHLAELNDVTRKVAGVEKGGLYVAQVVPESPAARAGLKNGDALLDLGGKRVMGLEGLRRQLRHLGAGTKTRALIARDGVQKSLTIRLGKRPTQAVQAPVRRAPVVASKPKPNPKPKPKPKPKSQRKPVVKKPAWLGVVLADDFAQRRRPDGEPLGIEVEEVTPGGPGAKAGLKVGDIILQMNGKAIQGFKDLKRLVGKSFAGQKVKVAVRRGNGKITTTLRFGSR